MRENCRLPQRQSDDAADVLFRAGEIYGKLKDWAGVTRVNQEFMRKFGNDADRAIQALCMSGVALYMQNRQTEAAEQLTKAIAAYAKLPKPSSTNKYYAAKAEFTIGEILLEAMNAVSLTLPKETYKKQLKAKSELLDKVVTQYSRVVKYQISEWTTRGIFSIAKAYEDFGVGIFRQQRPDNASLDERLALELGIAQAVEEYFVNKAAHYHEENVKLAIKEKIEDKYVLDSRQKLTSLPYMAGSNYLSLVDIAQNATGTQKLDGFALIAKKLELLQKIGSFQERAIVLFLKSLENGSRYQQIDESYTKASSFITKTAFTVGKTYADIATTARSAPVPSSFDPYESFVYKTKLLKQIEAYEDKSQEYFLRTVKIAEAYKIEDDFVKQTRDALPKLLFVRGRCYDVLCVNLFREPPFPAGASEAEKDEYRARFEEIGLQFQETAFDLYKSILSYAQQQYATGEYVTHAYVRMFQKSPKDYGTKTEKLDKRVVTSGSDWKCSTDTAAGWTSLDFKDTAWKPAGKGTLAPGVKIAGFPDSLPHPMWAQVSDAKMPPVYTLALRRTFYNTDVLKEAHLWISAIDEYHVFLNEKQLVPITPDTLDWAHAQDWDLLGKLRDGKNVLAVFVRNNIRLGFGCMPYLTYTVAANSYVPQPPGIAAPLDAVKVTEGAWEFPAIDNFTLTKQSTVKK
jgi:hypothetical protein